MKSNHPEPVRIQKHTVISGGTNDEETIDGVVVHPLTLLPDDRGDFAEIFRTSNRVADRFEVLQTSLTHTRAGVIKAFHYHVRQDDIFCPLTGTVRIALVDFRPDSPTHGLANSIFAGEQYLKAVRIPAGVAHGYEVLPGPDLTMVYYTNRFYDPEDEYRIPHDDPGVRFPSWGIQNR